MDGLREIGYSDKAFFYKPVRNLRISVVLKKELELDKLKCAVKGALDDFDEYRVTPVRDGRKVYYMHNDREVAFFPYDDTGRFFGTDEINGYLFYILYEEKAFMLSLFHGLTDYKGMWAFLNDIIYRYALETGLNVPDIRIKDAPLSDEDRYDPYSLFADKDASVVMPEGISGNSLFIPCEKYNITAPVSGGKCAENTQTPGGKIPEDLELQHEYTLTVNAPQFLAMVHEWNTSASCALGALISNALADLYGAEGQDVLFKITCDIRPFFGSATKVNMSEAVLLASTADLREKPLGEHCAELRCQMKSQLCKENFSRFMAAGIDLTSFRAGEKESVDVTVPSHKLTFVLTYPGRMDLPEEYGSLVSDFELKGYFPIETVRFSIKSTGDELRIGIDQVFDGDGIIRAIAEEFEALGFETRVKDEGRFGGDKYSLERIRERG